MGGSTTHDLGSTATYLGLSPISLSKVMHKYRNIRRGRRRFSGIRVPVQKIRIPNVKRVYSIYMRNIYTESFLGRDTQKMLNFSSLKTPMK